jgi:hypothetical protein
MNSAVSSMPAPIRRSERRSIRPQAKPPSEFAIANPYRNCMGQQLLPRALGQQLAQLHSLSRSNLLTLDFSIPFEVARVGDELANMRTAASRQ